MYVSYFETCFQRHNISQAVIRWANIIIRGRLKVCRKIGQIRCNGCPSETDCIAMLCVHYGIRTCNIDTECNLFLLKLDFPINSHDRAIAINKISCARTDCYKFQLFAFSSIWLLLLFFSFFSRIVEHCAY